MRKNIFLIGSGNIGSRHVESLAKSKNLLNLHIVDPNKNNLNKTRKIFNKSILYKNKVKAFYYKNIVKINKKIDIVIIATNSDVRRKVIENFFNLNSSKNLILEKVAFQKISDFRYVIKILNNKKVNCYVNFPRRLFPDYEKLRNKISKEKQIHLSVLGMNWGMACNSLHMLDLFKFLTKTKKIKIEQVSLKNKIFKSDRVGFIELKGTLKFITPRGDTLLLCDLEGKKNKLTYGGIKIENKNFFYLIKENIDKIIYIDNRKKLKIESKPFKFINQSNLTNIFVNDLLNNKEIKLTKINEAFEIHKIILEIFTKHIKKYDKKIKGCPIT